MDGIRSSHASRDNLGVVFAGGAEEIAFLTIPFLQENILRERERVFVPRYQLQDP